MACAFSVQYFRNATAVAYVGLRIKQTVVAFSFLMIFSFVFVL